METIKETHINGNSKNHIWIKLSLLLVLVGGVSALIYHSDWIRIFLHKDQLLHFLESLGPLASVVFVVLQAFQVVAAPTKSPSDSLRRADSR